MTQNRHPLSPRVFPYPWASDWGEDVHGLWQAFTYQKVRYAFRWIEPGTYMMGSPEDEPERSDGSIWGAETQHEVTLSNGFWLGETTVTQALWKAVIGNNPSHFDDNEHNPVEQISWDDSQPFIGQLNTLLNQGMQALGSIDPVAIRLPFEAEWEYACRAGTKTPFHFGDSITTSQVNYDGNYPYNNDAEGEYRQRTVAVKSFPCNAWGLYEMHGNVWEWCEDRYQEDLGSGSVLNPMGSEEGARRVLRGGSWDYYGRSVRSAIRDADSPGDRFNGIGVRLAFGQPSLGKQ